MLPLPRIRYNNINIDFDKPVSKYHPSVLHKIAGITPESGITEWDSSYTKEKIEALLDFTDAQKIINEIREFYEWAKSKQTFEFWRDRNLGGYWSFEGKSLKNNNRVDGTFTRAHSSGQSNAYYFDPSTQLLTNVSAENTARFPQGKFGRGILIEATRKNELNTDLTAWSYTNITPSHNTSETKDPMGGNAASKLVATAASGYAQFTTAKTIGTDDGVLTAYLKCQSGNVPCHIDIQSTSTGQLVTKAVTAVPNGPDGNGFTRFDVAYESTGSKAGYWMVLVSIDNNGDTVYFYLPQLEVGGADVLYPTEPILANGLTRNPERLEIAAANIINQNKGTILFWIKPKWIFDKHGGRMLFHSDGTNDRHLSYFITAGGNHEVRFYRQDGLFIQVTSYAQNDFTQDQWSHIGITYDNEVGLTLYVNGEFKDNQLSGTPMSAAEPSTYFALGAFVAGGSAADALFDELLIYQNVLSAAEIKQIYNRQKAEALERNYWPALELLIPDFEPEIIKGTDMYSYLLEALEVIS